MDRKAESRKFNVSKPTEKKRKEKKKNSLRNSSLASFTQINLRKM